MVSIFVDKSYVIASILNVKINYFYEDFISLKELNYLTNLLQEEFNNNNFNVCILDKVNKNHFAISDVIKINSNYTFEGVKSIYQGNSPLEIFPVLWNEELILKKIIEFKLLEINDAKIRFNNKQKKLLLNK